MIEETTEAEEQPASDTPKQREPFGQPLFPFTGSRRFAADSMGLRWGYATEDSAMIAAGKYSGALRDTATVLWLCSIPNASEQSAEQIRAKQWNVQRADSMPKEAYEEAKAFAEKHGFTNTIGDRFKEAYRAFIDIMLAIEDAKFRVESESGGAPVHEEDDSGNV